MKNILPILAMTSIFAVSCQNKNTSDTSAGESGLGNEVSAKRSTNCYFYSKNRDTASLKLVTTGEKVSGELTYGLYEKDRNSGTIDGVVKGDTIIADYTFKSEGTQSKRQVVWLKKDGKLLEGFGEQEEVGTEMRFKTRSKLKFTGSIEFSAVDCK